MTEKDPKRVAAGRKAQRNGKRGASDLAKLLQTAGYEAERGRDGATGDQDVRHSIPGIWVECKREAAFSCLTRAMNQADGDAGDRAPTVWSKTNRAEWLVTMKASDFFALIKENILE